MLRKDKAPQDASDIMLAAHRADLTMTAILREAGVSPATWARIKSGRPYKPDTLTKVQAGLVRLIAGGK